MLDRMQSSASNGNDMRKIYDRLHELHAISIPLIPGSLRPRSLSDHQRARAPIAPRTTAKMPAGAMLDPALGAEEDAAAPDPDSDAWNVSYNSANARGSLRMRRPARR